MRRIVSTCFATLDMAHDASLMRPTATCWSCTLIQASNNPMNEISIQNLDGYLQSLRRLSGNVCDFWVEIFEVQNDIQDSLARRLPDRPILLFDKVNVGYGEIARVLDEHLISKLHLKDELLKKLFVWDIFEYIRLSYPSQEIEDDPISSGNAFVVHAESDFHGKYVYIVISAGTKAVAIGLASRAC